MKALDAVDRALLNRIQSGFPLTPHPYRNIARELEMTEDEVIQRLTRLKQTGIIRRIGGNCVPDKLGFVSTLCAAKVPADQIEAFTRTVNRYPGVTHNYQRDHEYNIWFTVIAPSREAIAAHLQEIATATGVMDILNLPATEVFKIRAQFDVSADDDGEDEAV